MGGSTHTPATPYPVARLCCPEKQAALESLDDLIEQSLEDLVEAGVKKGVAKKIRKKIDKLVQQQEEGAKEDGEAKEDEAAKKKKEEEEAAAAAKAAAAAAAAEAEAAEAARKKQEEEEAKKEASTAAQQASPGTEEISSREWSVLPQSYQVGGGEGGRPSIVEGAVVKLAARHPYHPFRLPRLAHRLDSVRRGWGAKFAAAYEEVRHTSVLKIHTDFRWGCSLFAK